MAAKSGALPSSARIVEVRPHRVREELDRGRIVVLAGFQGVNPVTKEITTLGRGGSDTTAVAMAAALKAERCEEKRDGRPRMTLNCCYRQESPAQRPWGEL